ncbi:peptidoglycan-binding domain-containing protein, partial [Streptomyces sp. GSL17-113]|uniref:peptidoglycan-binding domain-containing protein n=1 Tax=Streptomyces sp. GSL17-113 TaxID=3115365 RepID=UPI002E77C133
EHIRFVARERHGGVAAVRTAIGAELTEFQEAHRLPVTGEADVATWRALMAAQQPPVRSHPTPTPTG